MRVFVTGIAGFAGPVAAAALLEAGHVVHGLVRGAGPWPRLAGLPLAPGALHRGDLADGRLPDVVRARPFNHTGPGQDPAFVCSALARQLALIEAGKQDPVVRVGNADPVRDFSDVRDIAAGYVALLERGRSGEAYNLCSGDGVSIAEVIALLRTHARVPVRG